MRKGQKITEEMRKNMIISHIGHKASKGAFKKGHMPWNKSYSKFKTIQDKESSQYGKVLKDKFGITFEEYKQMCEKQNNVCAICGSKNIRGGKEQRLSVDHCHKTKKVRGLLCHSCNVGIGLLKDNTLFLQKAIEYLMNNQYGYK